MSDEEKKAIERVKDMFEDVTIKDIDEQSITIYGVAMLDVIKVLTIVEKQSKEIEEAEQKERKAYINGANDAHELCNKKWENKINAKIEELQNKSGGNLFHIQQTINAEIRLLQSLLEKE